MFYIYDFYIMYNNKLYQVETETLSGIAESIIPDFKIQNIEFLSMNQKEKLV